MKKLLSIVLAIVLMVSVCPLGLFTITASAETATSGTTGDCTWELDGTVLTISGNGEMEDYNYKALPWGTGITKVIIENGITSIGDKAFYGCTSLESVTIPDSVASIKFDAFMGCTGLETVNITNIESWFNIDFTFFESNPVYYAKKLYLNGELLTNLVIPDTISKVKSFAFSNCTSLTNITIHNGVTSIGNCSFYGCTDISSVAIPASVTSISYNAFSVEKIYYGGSKSDWEKTGADFGETPEIQYYSLSDNNGTIGNCTWLLTGTLLVVCGNGKMADCSIGGGPWRTTDVTDVIIEYGVTSIGQYAFNDCTSLESITIPDSVTSIDSSAFSNCTSLTSITIPKNVTTIGSSTFEGCTNLKSIVISDKLEDVGNSAFKDCTNLKDVWYGGSESDKANIEFTTYNGCFKNATWHYNTCESTKHTYSGECDKTCNNCEWVRSVNENISHTYDNACDSECNVCGFVRTVPDHVYDDEYDTDCNICGAVREVGSPNLEIYATNLVLKNNITVNYYVDKTLFDNAGYTKPYIEFVFNGATVIQKNYDVTSDGLYYVFKFDGVMPNQINDTVKAILHTKVGDNELSSLSSEYSVATYCYNMLNQYSDNVALRTLLVDLLNYGTTAQIYSDYNIISLANAQLTETQKTWGTQTADTLSNTLNAKYTEIEDVTVRWKSVGVNLKDNVAVRFKISAENKDNLTVKVSTSSGDEWTLSNKYFEYAGNGCYYVYFEELNVCQMREKIYATVYEGDTAVSNTLCYSIESYVYSQQSSSNEKLKNLLDAMIKYGDSAYRYKQTEN